MSKEFGIVFAGIKDEFLSPLLRIPDLWVVIMNLNYIYMRDGLCGLVVRVPGYRFRGLGFDFRLYQIF
jgi:hypothetical protein